MNREKLIQELVELSTIPDLVSAHIEAIALLLQYIDDEEITEAYGMIDKWYA